MKKAIIYSIAAMAIMMAACTSEEAPNSQPASGGEGIPFSATITTGSQTRAITENTTAKTLETAFAEGEKVALIHNNIVEEMTVTKNTDGTATISGTISGSPADGDDVTVIYPASAVDATTKAVKTDLLAAQDGTLATIATDLDLCQSSGAKLSVNAGHASLNGIVVLANQLAIVKFSLQDAGGTAINASSFVIKDGSDNVITTVTPSPAASDLYVAMAPASAADFNFAATVGTEAYTYAKTGVTLAAGTYYQSPIKMTFTKHSGTIEFSKESDSQTWSATSADNTYQLAATVTGDGTVTYSINADNTCGASINASTGALTFTKVGTVTVTATVADSETYTYASNTASYTLTINPATMTVTANDYSGTYDTNAHGITVNAPTGATVKYGTTADNCTLTSLTYTDAGTYTVYYKVTMDNYTPATGSATVTINKAAGSISFPAATSEHVNDDNAFDYPATITGDGTITGYSSSNINVATVDKNGRVTIVSTGTAIITATVADGTNYTYSPNSATYTLTVKPGGLKVPSTYNDGGDPF
jgi:uncharacterized protein YjdB